MKKINQKAAKVFNKLIENLNWNNPHKRLGGEIGGDSTFMPVSVEIVDEVPVGLIFSIAHYDVQNGDLMADPEVTFLQHQNGGIFPMTFRNDYMGINERNIYIEEGKIQFRPQKQRSLATFCGTWMENIKQQQRL